MVSIIAISDLPAGLQDVEMVDLLVAGANARAARVAPCLASTETPPSVDQLAEAKLVLIGAVKRWAETGAGAVTQQSAGPFSMSVDTRQRAGYNLWPSEIQDLQAICSNGPVGRQAFSLDTAPSAGVYHLERCALNFGADYCSCGADIAGYPLYEQG